jgi:threonine dehydrogenase-like Zn-dependent dehydrogenase
LLGAMALRHAGFATTVYSRDPEPNERADLAHAIGAGYVSSQELGVDELAEAIGGIDVVYEAVGASRLAFDVLRVLGANGIFVFTGVPARKEPIAIDTDLLMRNIVLQNQVVVGSVNAGRADFESAVSDLAAFLERWPRALRTLIGGRYPMEDVHALLAGTRPGIKNVVALPS